MVTLAQCLMLDSGDISTADFLHYGHSVNERRMADPSHLSQKNPDVDIEDF